jgi:hypothetical protein
MIRVRPHLLTYSVTRRLPEGAKDIMNRRPSFPQKLSRLKTRLRDPEWRRYGALLLAGKGTAIAVLRVAMAFLNPDLIGLSAPAADPVLKGKRHCQSDQ